MRDDGRSVLIQSLGNNASLCHLTGSAPLREKNWVRGGCSGVRVMPAREMPA